MNVELRVKNVELISQYQNIYISYPLGLLVIIISEDPRDPQAKHQRRFALFAGKTFRVLRGSPGNGEGKSLSLSRRRRIGRIGRISRIGQLPPGLSSYSSMCQLLSLKIIVLSLIILWKIRLIRLIRG